MRSFTVLPAAIAVLILAPWAAEAGPPIWTSPSEKAEAYRVIRVFETHVVMRRKTHLGRYRLKAIRLKDGVTLFDTNVKTATAWWDGDKLTHQGGWIDLAAPVSKELAATAAAGGRDQRRPARARNAHKIAAPFGLVTLQEGRTLTLSDGTSETGSLQFEADLRSVQAAPDGVYVELDRSIVCLGTDGKKLWSTDLGTPEQRIVIAGVNGVVILDSKARFILRKTGKVTTFPLPKRKLQVKSADDVWLTDDHRWVLFQCGYQIKDGWQAGLVLLDTVKGTHVKQGPSHGIARLSNAGIVGQRVVDKPSAHLGWETQSELISLGDRVKRLVIAHVPSIKVGSHHWVNLAVSADKPRPLALEVFKFPRSRIKRIKIKDTAFARALIHRYVNAGNGERPKGPRPFINWGAWPMGAWYQTPDEVWTTQLFGGKKRSMRLKIEATSKEKISWAVPTDSGILVARRGQLSLCKASGR